MRVASFRQCVDACDVHFFPTPTLRQFSAAGHQQVFKYRHVASLKGFYVTQRKNLTFVQTLVASRVKSRKSPRPEAVSVMNEGRPIEQSHDCSKLTIVVVYSTVASRSAAFVITGQIAAIRHDANELSRTAMSGSVH